MDAALAVARDVLAPGGWLNAEQAKDYLGFRTLNAFYQAVHRGEIPVHKWRRRIRCKREELDALLGEAIRKEEKPKKS